MLLRQEYSLSRERLEITEDVSYPEIAPEICIAHSNPLFRRKYHPAGSPNSHNKGYRIRP